MPFDRAQLAELVTTLALRSKHSRRLLRPSEIRVFAAVVAALVGIAHLAILLHFVLIRHEYCAEHRHLVHSAEYQRAPAFGALLARSNAAAVSSVERLDDHDHCTLPLGFGKGAYLICRASVALCAPLGTHEACGVDRSRAVLPVATLLFAPKLSPPLA